MEYSLQSLTKQTELNEITLENIVNKLNLIGFEVDDIIIEPLIFNQFINDIRLLIKIPANREDLLVETLLLNELSTIFSLKKYQLWKNLKNNYSFLLKQKYSQFYIYESSSIFSETSSSRLTFSTMILGCLLPCQERCRDLGLEFSLL